MFPVRKGAGAVNACENNVALGTPYWYLLSISSSTHVLSGLVQCSSVACMLTKIQQTKCHVNKGSEQQ